MVWGGVREEIRIEGLRVDEDGMLGIEGREIKIGVVK